MSTHDSISNAAGRRVMDRLESVWRVPILNLREGDVWVLLAPPIATLLVGSSFGLGLAIVPSVGGALLCSLVVVMAAPSHLTAKAWLSDLARGVFLRPRFTLAAPANANANESWTRGGLVQYLPIESDERAQDLSAFRRSWPYAGVVERDDGSMEAFLEIEPANMDFATTGDWQTVQETAARFANRHLDFPLSMHVTTRPFPVEQLVETLEERLDDPDVRDNAALYDLITEYRERRPADLDESHEHRVFIGVEADPIEGERRDTEPGPRERLSRVPVLGLLLAPVITSRSGGLDAQQRQRIADRLETRVKTVRSELVERLDGWAARRLDTVEIFELEASFWNGLSAEQANDLYRATPAMSASRRDAGVDSRHHYSPEGTGPTDAEVAGQNRTTIVPSAVEWQPRAARLGEQWTRTLSVVAYPDRPKDGYLSGLFSLTDVEFDLTVRLRPRPQESARNELQTRAESLQADAQLDRSAHGSYLAERASDALATYQAVEAGEQVFEQSLVVTVRAETREALREAVSTVTAALRDRPAGVEPRTAVHRQDEALQTAAPLGGDELGRSSVALGGAVGAVLASPNDSTLLEPKGIEVGTHCATETPLVVDPFARDDGYAMFTVGDPGSGKSFGAKQRFIRSVEQHPDRLHVVLEPLDDWKGVVDAVDGTHITVGGTLGLNPLEIRSTPESVLNERGDDASPFRECRDRAVGFLVNFFGHRDVDLGPRRSTLEAAIDTAYERQGITEAPETHANESPKMRDVLDILSEMIEDPAEYVVRSEVEAEQIADDARWLLSQLRPFASGGQLEQLGRQSEFDLRNEDIVYLDLAQQGGRMSGHTTLMMELLVSLVYERAKETEREVVFVIDEARYLMKRQSTLEYLETIFRHHRHHDLSIRLLTQTVDEFFDHEIGEVILDQCAIKQFHKLDGMDREWAAEFGLNDQQMRFVQQATPGSEEHGYSQALLGVDGEWRGMEVRSMPKERDVIDATTDR